MTDTRPPHPGGDTFTDLLDAIGADDDTHISLCWADPNDEEVAYKFKAAAVGNRETIETEAPRKLPHDLWFSVQPLRHGIPQGRRGVAADVIGCRTLYCDLDVKDGAFTSVDDIWPLINKLSDALGMAPAYVTESGRGLHPYWPLTGPGTTWAHGDTDAAARGRALLRAWEARVRQVVGPDVKVDSGVYELARVLRVPGSWNVFKDPTHPVPVVGHIDTGTALNFATVESMLALTTPPDTGGTWDKAEPTTDRGRVLREAGRIAHIGADLDDLMARLRMYAEALPGYDPKRPWVDHDLRTMLTGAIKKGWDNGATPTADRADTDDYLTGVRATLKGQGHDGPLSRELGSLTIEGAQKTHGDVAYLEPIEITRELVAALDGWIPDTYQMPASYFLSNGGMWHATFPKNKDGEPTRRNTQISHTLVLPVGTGLDDDGHATVRLAYRFRDDVRVAEVPLGALDRADKFATAVGSRYILVEPGYVAFARKLMATNAHNLVRRRVARTLGWQSDGTFIPAAIDRPELVLAPIHREQTPAIKAHHARGTAEHWQEAVARVEHYPVARTALAAAFAATLIKPLGVEPFTVDIAGTTSTGKTTLAKLAASVSMDPSEGGGGMDTWAATAYACELRTNVSHGVLVVRDETQKARGDKDKIAQIIYQNGMGKTRGGDWASGLKLHTVTLSTGEQSIVDWVTDGGAAARVIPIRCAPFGTDWSAEQSNALTAATRLNYGHALPAWTNLVLSNFTNDAFREAMIAQHAQIANQLSDLAKSNAGQRLAGFLAVLVLADKLACGFGILPFEAQKEDVWADVIGADAVGSASATDRAAYAAGIIHQYILANPHRIYQPTNEADHEIMPPHSGWLGRRYSLDGAPCVALIPNEMAAVLARNDINIGAVLPGLKAGGHLWADGNKTARNVRWQGKVQKMYVLPQPE